MDNNLTSIERMAYGLEMPEEQASGRFKDSLKLAADCIAYVREAERQSHGAASEEVDNLFLHLLALAQRIEEASVDG